MPPENAYFDIVDFNPLSLFAYLSNMKEIGRCGNIRYRQQNKIVNYKTGSQYE